MFKLCLSGDGYTDKHFTQLAAHGFDVTHKPYLITQDELQVILPEFDAYVLGGDERLTEKELHQAHKLRVISFVGSGYTSFIDEAAAKKQGIAIKNTPAVNAPAVAEHAVGFLIGLQRKLFQHNQQVKKNCIVPCQTEELSSLRVGIVGLGAIGSRIARILRLAFDCEVIYTSRQRKEALEKELNLTSVSMDTLFSSADIIVLSLPTNAETEYFIDDAMLAKTKAGVIIINTAGARLIEPIALKKHLDSRHIGSVAFDGYYIEPLPNLLNDPFHLLALPDDQFIVTPHIAAKTTQSWSRMIDMSINNIIHFFNH